MSQNLGNTFNLIIFQLQKSLGIELMGVSETCLCVDVQNVQFFKDWPDIAWDIQILMYIYKINKINTEKIRTNKHFLHKIIA